MEQSVKGMVYGFLLTTITVIFVTVSCRSDGSFPSFTVSMLGSVVFSSAPPNLWFG